MTRKTVQYYSYGSVSTIEVTIGDDGFGVIDRNAMIAFTHGQCHALALAIHQLTGWPIKGVGGYDAPDSPAHCLVWWSERRQYVDIDGARNRHGYTRVVNRSISPKLANKLTYYVKPNLRVAIPFAKTVLRDLGIEV